MHQLLGAPSAVKLRRRRHVLYALRSGMASFAPARWVPVKIATRAAAEGVVDDQFDEGHATSAMSQR